MKLILSFFIAVMLLFASCTATYHATVAPPPVNPPPQQQNETSFQVFYDELGAYGKWMDYPGEGYVWSPGVDPSFQPYSTNGHWVYSDQGWTWVSDYNWGWAPFHYGRWFYEDGYGWLWLPGHEWAPAWVTWGHSGNYYGWAPLGPHIASNQQWTPPERSWTFVPQEHIAKTNISQYVVDRSTNNTIVKNVTIINNNTSVVNKSVVNNNTVNNTNNTNNVVNNTNNTRNNTTNTNNVNNNTNNIKTNTTNTNNVNNNTNNVRNNTTNVNNNHNVVVNQGPQINEVEKLTNMHIQKAAIVENNRPAQTQINNNKITMYRPIIAPAGMQRNGNKPAPQKVEIYNKTKP